jgi:hypothetical protein
MKDVGYIIHVEEMCEMCIKNVGNSYSQDSTILYIAAN